MERHPPLPMTPFDEMVSTKQLQTMKLLLPYLPAAFQKIMGFYIKFTELQNTLKYFSNSVNNHNTKTISSPMSLFEDFRPYINNQEAQSLDSVLSILNILEIMKNMNEDAMPDLSNFDDITNFMNVMNMFQFDTTTNTDSQKGNENNE